MITTSVMVKLGRVEDNKMVHMQLNNKKLVNRGVLMLMDELHIHQDLASTLLEKHKSVKNVLDNYKNKFL